MTIVLFSAKNDFYGNPQRVFTLINNNGDIVKAWDEGYHGSHAIPQEYRHLGYLVQQCSVRDYKKLLKLAA
jgi:K+-transporting ATPase c subunit